ncbi:MAG TPA: D-alanyl-D-alanine carboxypeptidase, partial [Bryobacterales bacterium]|nr:D-alanyl-D-alanine carboxypeptidase [Bryobacterales bacterium]
MRIAVFAQRLTLLFLLASLAAQPATLAERIERVLAAPAARRAFWGIRAVDLDSGQILYQLNADHLFTPASNTKLFSTAMALARLGPAYRFLTRLAASAPPDEQGRIAGNLLLEGGGDPNFSSRVLPYEKRTEFAPNRLAPIEDFADEVAAAGIREIDGNIVGDDTLYVWERYPQGWALDDTVNADGAPVTALVINDNTVALSIRPAERAGEPAVVSISP